MNPAADGPARWEKLADRSLAATRIFDLRSIRYRHPQRGTERDFYVIAAPEWVNILALTPDHRLVLVRQFRYGIDTFSLEIPGGLVDAGEAPLSAGVRELREETGFAGGPARMLGQVHPNPAIQNNRCHIVLIEQAVPSAAMAWDHDEEIEVTTLPVDEVYALARAGGITHSLVLNALLLFEPRWRELRGGGV